MCVCVGGGGGYGGEGAEACFPGTKGIQLVFVVK